MKRLLSSSRSRRATLAAAGISLIGCGGSPVVPGMDGNTSQSLTIPVGAEFTVTLHTVGPGAYAVPPTISSAAVQFLDVSEPGPAVPSGPTQRFRFKATSHGDAIVAFRHSGMNPAVDDTIHVH
jgi:hypothetical protein